MVKGWQRVPSASRTQPLKSICQSRLGASFSKRCMGAGEQALAATRPFRRKIPCTVEGAGGFTPCRSMSLAILRAPHTGWASLASSTRASIAASLRQGLLSGRRERSQSSRSPAAQRPSHL